MEDYKEKYEQALENLKRIKTANKDNKELVNFIEYQYPELKESEDERIRKHLIKHFGNKSKEDWNGVPVKSILAWLEKHAEQNIKMIQWKGDNLREVVKFTGKSPKFNEWFKTWDDYENYVHSHGNIFKLFCEDGSHYEVPEGAWIVKTPDGYNVASKAKYKQKIEQKPTDKFEPKFKIENGQWYICIQSFVLNGNIVVAKGRTYESREDNTISGEDARLFIDKHDGDAAEYFKPWTIQDAKDGDVVVLDDVFILIFKEIVDLKLKTPLLKKVGGFYFKSYINLDFLMNVFEQGNFCYNIGNSCHPATKEQCDLLFNKMKEAGYEWNAEKKELKKIEQKPAWSEEDEQQMKSCLDFLDNISCGDDSELNDCRNWLKSLKERMKGGESDGD